MRIVEDLFISDFPYSPKANKNACEEFLPLVTCRVNCIKPELNFLMERCVLEINHPERQSASKQNCSGEIAFHNFIMLLTNWTCRRCSYSSFLKFHNCGQIIMAKFPEADQYLKRSSGRVRTIIDYIYHAW